MGTNMEVTRRSFLGGAAVAGLAAGVAALSGCGSPSVASSNSTSKTNADAAASGDSFLDAPEPYTKWDEELSADVVVVGQGVAGVYAARKALEDGATVVTIEQAETPLYRSAQFGIINSEYQKSVGMEFSDEEINAIIDNLMKNFGGRVDRGIWQRWAKESGAIFDWMLAANPGYIAIDPKKKANEYDLRYDMETEVLTDWDGNATDASAVCIHNWPGNPAIDNDKEAYPAWEGPCELLPNQTPWQDAVAKEFVENENLTQRFSTWGRQLIVDDSGAVTGVFAEDIDGNIIKINAERGVILATGGYLANKEMTDKYLPELSLFPNQIWYQTDAKGELSHNGSGICMGAWAGGAIDDNPHAFILHGFGGGLGQDPFLFVNDQGKRFMNENILPNLISQNIGHAPNGHIYQIFDDNYADQVGAMQSGHAGIWKIVDSMEDLTWGNFMEGSGGTTREAVEAASDFVCSSIEEIAEATGMPVDALQTTIERYNELAVAGFDADFGKPASRLFPIEKAPFYVKEFTTHGGGMSAETVFTSLNGLKSNCEAQVLKADGTPVPNLYCAGNCQGSRFAFDYPVTFMGVSHGLALTYGYIAGMNAAANNA